ncbi:MOSC domain-containing protein [Aaosphaeria arxii CBS 175.79]|uniref:MOSC domain-containing protein n=1 Tax=Aaosphaeria arxii CBS 175.79 TaxID=1450172 RepID=A0A6A5Y2V5_9PLEO|nr:MOSC domain-containing protein [Aaosphaeria arxii CBS 175.79]KAF2019367.1 MOSC domain-containing protein [Aaosphaeria arxii CBS 175.79]
MPSDNALDFIVVSIQNFFRDFNIRFTPITAIVTTLALLVPLLFLFILARSQQEVHLPAPAGCRRLQLEGTSNLKDQYSKAYSKGSEPSSSKPWTVKALFVYPVKSCAGIEIDKASVVRSGFQYDRQFTLAQYHTGLPDSNGKVKSEWRFITLRSFPRLAKVETQVWVPDPNAPDYDPNGEWVLSEGCLVMRFPFTPDTDFSIEGLKNYGKILAAKLAGQSEPMLEFRVPFNPTKERMQKKQYKSEKMIIWNDQPHALNMDREVSAELLDKLRYTLGVTNPLTLFRIDTTKYREAGGNAPSKQDTELEPIIGMHDAYPIHIMNIASVQDVSSRLPKGYKPLNVLRYRANVYLTGPPAFDEDDWKRAQIGNGNYHISCRTTRCKLPNVDPETAIADRNEPGTTMRKYRIIDAGSKSACLGMQVTPLAEGEIKIGDQIQVQERGEHFFIE